MRRREVLQRAPAQGLDAVPGAEPQRVVDSVKVDFGGVGGEQPGAGRSLVALNGLTGGKRGGMR